MPPGAGDGSRFDTGRQDVTERMTRREALHMARVLPSVYRGTLYRSRAEARWAAFFDFLHLPVDYEYEGWATGREAYLPDFLLAGQALWAEVKPSIDADPGGVAKLRNFIAARRLERGVVLPSLQPGEMTFLLMGPDGAGDTWDDDRATWLTCPDGYHYDIQPVPELGCRHCPSTAGYWYYGDKIEEASAFARSFRFGGR